MNSNSKENTVYIYKHGVIYIWSFKIEFCADRSIISHSYQAYIQPKGISEFVRN